METVRFALIAEIFTALSHPKRLEILYHLGKRQSTAGELASLTGLSKANISQHLNVLKGRGLIYCDKIGTFCHYRLTGPRILEMCDLVRQQILEQIDIAEEKRKSLLDVLPFRNDPA